MGRTLAVLLMLVVATSPVGAQQALPPRVTDDGAPVLPADFAAESATVVDPTEWLLRLPRLPPGLPRPELRAREAMEVHERAQERLRVCRAAGADTRPCVQACAVRWVVGPPRRLRARSVEGYSACFVACHRAVAEHDATCLAEATAWQELALRRRFGASAPAP